jgi:hypothetical protein
VQFGGSGPQCVGFLVYMWVFSGDTCICIGVLHIGALNYSPSVLLLLPSGHRNLDLPAGRGGGRGEGGRLGFVWRGIVCLSAVGTFKASMCLILGVHDGIFWRHLHMHWGQACWSSELPICAELLPSANLI